MILSCRRRLFISNPVRKMKSVHIPVILSQTGLKELVYNDFHIGEDCDVTIIAGCGIHNSGDAASEHDGIHTFFVERMRSCAMWRSITEVVTVRERES